MGIIRAAVNAVSGTLSDSYLDVFEADRMGERTVFTKGVRIRKGQNMKATDDTVSNGSLIHVYPNQFMLLVDGGKVVDYTAEPGYYKVSNSSMPSLFNGEFGDTLKDTWNRIKFGGGTPTAQKVFFINMKNIEGIKFGTRNPLNYFDNFYNAELSLRIHGTYSIRICQPMLFFENVVPADAERLEIEKINEQHVDEFLGALGATISQMSVDGVRISHVASHTTKVNKYMADALDEEWKAMRGIEILSVGMNPPSYDDDSKKMIAMRNEGAMLSDATIREGYVQGHMARGLEAAGSNANGAMNGFMGLGMGMHMGGMGTASQTNLQQMHMQQAQARNINNVGSHVAQAPSQHESVQQTSGNTWKCSCGTENIGKFCMECGNKKPQPKEETGWTCSCGTVNKGKFCMECGQKKPSADWTCSCGAVNKGKFCAECGSPRP